MCFESWLVCFESADLPKNSVVTTTCSSPSTYSMQGAHLGRALLEEAKAFEAPGKGLQEIAASPLQGSVDERGQRARERMKLGLARSLRTKDPSSAVGAQGL